MTARPWLPVAVLAGLVAIGGLVGVAVHRHRAHAAGAAQLARAEWIAHAVAVRGASPSTECLESDVVACLATDQPVRAATGQVAASINQAAHTQPRIRCFTVHLASASLAVRGPASLACVVDLKVGTHVATAWIQRLAVYRVGAPAGTAVMVEVS